MRFAGAPLVLSLALSLSCFACGAGSRKSASTGESAVSNTIAIKDFQFSPQDLVIPAGSTVTWINKDEEPHKVVEVNSVFTSKPLDTDDKFTFEFKSAGSYEFFCALHPRMTGKITVQGK